VLVTGDLKRICEIDLGLVSQCCCAKQVFKMNTDADKSRSEDKCQGWFSIDYAFVCVAFTLCCLCSPSQFAACSFVSVR
jgi:hypothetical protein